MQRGAPGVASLLNLDRFAQLAGAGHEGQASRTELSDLILFRGEHAHGLTAHLPLDTEFTVELDHLGDPPVVVSQRSRQALPDEVLVTLPREKCPAEHDPRIARHHHVGDDIAERIQGLELSMGDSQVGVTASFAISPGLMSHEPDDQLTGSSERDIHRRSPVGRQIGGQDELLGL